MSDEKLDQILKEIAWVKTGITNLGARVGALENEQILNSIIDSIRSFEHDSKQRDTELYEAIQTLIRKVDIMNRELLDVKAITPASMIGWIS